MHAFLLEQRAHYIKLQKNTHCNESAHIANDAPTDASEISAMYVLSFVLVFQF